MVLRPGTQGFRVARAITELTDVGYNYRPPDRVLWKPGPSPFTL